MIQKITVGIEGQALSELKALAKEYSYTLEAMVALSIGVAKDKNNNCYLADYDVLSGVALEGFVEDVWEVGQVVGARYYSETVYGAFKGRDGDNVTLALTENSIRAIGSKTGHVAVKVDDVFTL